VFSTRTLRLFPVLSRFFNPVPFFQRKPPISAPCFQFFVPAPCFSTPIPCPVPCCLSAPQSDRSSLSTTIDLIQHYFRSGSPLRFRTTMHLIQHYFCSGSALLSGNLSTTILHYDVADSALLSIRFSSRIGRVCAPTYSRNATKRHGFQLTK